MGQCAPQRSYERRRESLPVRFDQAQVGEEVSLGKRQVQETQQVSDTVKREEARVERRGDINVHSSDVVDEER